MAKKERDPVVDFLPFVVVLVTSSRAFDDGKENRRVIKDNVIKRRAQERKKERDVVDIREKGPGRMSGYCTI